MNRKRPTLTTPYSINTRTSERSTTSPTTPPNKNMEEEKLEEELNLDDMDDSSGLNIGLMKQFIKIMEKNITRNINAQIDIKVGGIKEDISEIKVQMEKSNGKFEEMQSRISTVEDKVNNLEQLGEEIDTIKTEWDDVLEEINIEACRARKNNVIIQGVTGGSKDVDIARENFNRTCKENLKLSQDWLDKVDIDEIYHFPPKGDGAWPLFVKFGKAKLREDLFKAAPNLKGSKIYLRNDLAPCLLRKRKKLLVEQETLRANPHNYQTRMRDSAFDVWMDVLKPNETVWESLFRSV